MKNLTTLWNDFKQNNIIAYRLLIYIIIFSSTITLLTMSFQLYVDYKNDLAIIDEQMEQVQNSRLKSIALSLWEIHYGQLESQLDGILSIRDIEFVQLEMFFEEDVIALGTPPIERYGITKTFEVTIDSLGEVKNIGRLKIMASKQNVVGRLKEKVLLIVISQFFKTFLVSIFILLIFYHLVTRHLSSMAHYAGILTLKKLAPPLKLDKKSKASQPDELDKVVHSINSMRLDLITYLKEQEKSKNALLESEDRLAKFMDSATDGFILFDSEFNHLEMNKVALEITGLTRKDVIGKKLVDVLPDIKNTPRYNAYKKVMDTGVPYQITDLTNHPLTGDKYIDLKVFKVGEGLGMIFSDITYRKQAEEEKLKLENRLQQAQKMESIGTLAGGIAHDFNNILSVILGFTEMAKDDCQPGSSISKDLDEVLGAGNRAKGLVQQILAFSRQDDTERIILQPASIVKETITMLRPSLPTTIEITQDIDAVTGLISVDPSQLSQILMNLCTNAFHAMEDAGGKLDISLKEVTLSNEDLVHEPDVTKGTFIQLSISDSGTGIAPAVKNKIFDPYFTTKETGKGTGMGLSLVHGIVKSYGGFITLYSELGEGTVFHVFLPTVKKEALTENEINGQIPIGRERILFVDDEEILTHMGKSMLERLGYHVTVRNNSLEALETFQNQPDTFDIVITDQTMPGMTGSDLSRRMLQIRPDIPIILCTGYSTIISEEKAKSMGIKEFAFKPLAKKDIAKLIRKVLDVS